MSDSISTLLTRNLQEVFGENDPASRRAAIDEIFNEDCVFYDPSGAEPVQLPSNIVRCVLRHTVDSSKPLALRAIAGYAERG